MNQRASIVSLRSWHGLGRCLNGYRFLARCRLAVTHSPINDTVITGIDSIVISNTITDSAGIDSTGIDSTGISNTIVDGTGIDGATIGAQGNPQLFSHRGD